MLLDAFRTLGEEEAGQDLSYRCYWTRLELWMMKRQGKICPIDATGRVWSCLGSYQLQINDVTGHLLILLHPKAETTSWEESISIGKVLQRSKISTKQVLAYYCHL